MLAQQRQALGLADLGRPLLKLTRLLVAGEFDRDVVLGKGIVGFALGDQHGGLGRGGADLQGRGAAVELLVRGKRLGRLPGPGMEITEQFLHLEEVVALRMLHEIVGHRLRRPGQIATRAEHGLCGGGGPDEINLGHHQRLGTIEFVRFDLANLFTGIGAAATEEHAAGILQ